MPGTIDLLLDVTIGDPLVTGTGIDIGEITYPKEIVDIITSLGQDPETVLPGTGAYAKGADVLIRLPEGGDYWITLDDIAAAVEYGAQILQIFETEIPPGETQPTVEVPAEFPETEEEAPSTGELATGVPAGGEPSFPSGVGGLNTLTLLQDLFPQGGQIMSWIDDLADIMGGVIDVATAPVGREGTVLTEALRLLDGGRGGRGAPIVGAQPAYFDFPGVDVGRQGAVSARGGPFFEGATRLRTRRILQFTHPETGRIVWYRNMGRPILWSGDRSTVRRWNRNVGPARRVGASRRRKR